MSKEFDAYYASVEEKIPWAYRSMLKDGMRQVWDKAYQSGYDEGYNDGVKSKTDETTPVKDPEL